MKKEGKVLKNLGISTERVNKWPIESQENLKLLRKLSFSFRVNNLVHKRKIPKRQRVSTQEESIILVQ